MLVTVYYPFTDERGLFPERSDLVESRFTRLGERHRFTRNLGRLVDRPRGGFQGWIGESTICAVHRSVRIAFDGWRSGDPLQISPRVAFKRLFFDGLRGYFSIGISLSGSAETNSNARALIELLSALATVPVMSSHRADGHTTLQHFSDLARDLYASGPVKKLKDLSSGDYRQHINFAKPILIVSMVGAGHMAASAFDHPLALKLRSPFQVAALGQQTAGGFINWPDATFVLTISSRNQADATKSRFLRVGVARLYLEAYALERMISLLQGPLFKQCDEEGQNLIGETLNQCLTRLHGARRPDIAGDDQSYDGLVASFARIFRPGHVADLETFSNGCARVPIFAALSNDHCSSTDNHRLRQSPNWRSLWEIRLTSLEIRETSSAATSRRVKSFPAARLQIIRARRSSTRSRRSKPRSSQLQPIKPMRPNRS